MILLYQKIKQYIHKDNLGKRYMFVTQNLEECNEVYKHACNVRTNYSLDCRIIRYVTVHSATNVSYVVDITLTQETVNSVDDTIYLIKGESVSREIYYENK